jgi:hypothetical protein
MSNDNSKRHDEGVFLTDAEIDKLIVATAAGRVANKQPFCEQDVETVVDWARGVRIDASLLGLLLDGKLVPAGVKDDGEIAYRPVTGTLSRAEARSYRAKLAQLQAGWTPTPPREFRISGDEAVDFALAETETASLRLAIETGNKHWKGPDLESGQMLTWAAECRNAEVLLASVLVGDVLPITGDGGQLTFRHTDELPPADQKEHRRKLRQLEVAQPH